MTKQSVQIAFKLVVATALCLASCLNMADAKPPSQDLDPKRNYFVNGQAVGYRGITLGDPSKWGQTVTGTSGESASGKIKINPDSFKSKDDAVHILWSAKDLKGELAIYGSPIDISSYKETAAITFDVKVNTPPTSSVNVGMDCTFPCRAEYDIQAQLKQLKPGTWSSVPVPLACLKSANFDLAKINGVFLLSTSGKLDLSIANVRLEDTPKSFKGCTTVNAEAQTPGLNPNFFYFVNGKVIGHRGLTLGDPGKWGLSVEGITGESAGGKITIRPEDFQGKGDAINIKWSKKDIKGELGIFGPAINIAAFKDLAALTFDVKVNSRPKESVMVGMDCGYPCRAEYEVGMLLRKLKKSTWTSFPIPLNCLKENNFDLSKISGVFVMSTQGKLDLSIANIRLEKLPAGSKSCKE